MNSFCSFFRVSGTREERGRAAVSVVVEVEVKSEKKKGVSAPLLSPSHHTATAPINVSNLPSAAVISESRRAKKRSVPMHLPPVHYFAVPVVSARPRISSKMAKKCSAFIDPLATQGSSGGGDGGMPAPAAASTTDAAGGGRCGGFSRKGPPTAPLAGWEKMKRGMAWMPWRRIVSP